jgi:hypothetical protein
VQCAALLAHDLGDRARVECARAAQRLAQDAHRLARRQSERAADRLAQHLGIGIGRLRVALLEHAREQMASSAALGSASVTRPASRSISTGRWNTGPTSTMHCLRAPSDGRRSRSRRSAIASSSQRWASSIANSAGSSQRAIAARPASSEPAPSPLPANPPRPSR